MLAHIYNGQINSNQILHIDSLGRHSDIYEMVPKLGRVLEGWGVRNLTSLTDFSISFYHCILCTAAHTRDGQLPVDSMIA